VAFCLFKTLNWNLTYLTIDPKPVNEYMVLVQYMNVGLQWHPNGLLV